MLEDVGDGGRLGMRAVREIVLGEAAPDVDNLVGLAGVGVEQMLEERIGGARNVGVGDGDEIVVHGCLESVRFRDVGFCEGAKSFGENGPEAGSW